MAFDRECEFVLVHALPVIADANQPAPTIAKNNVDLPCSGIDRILRQFLDDARWTLNHLARSNAVGDALGKPANPHQQSLTREAPIRHLADQFDKGADLA